MVGLASKPVGTPALLGKSAELYLAVRCLLLRKTQIPRTPHLSRNRAWRAPTKAQDPSEVDPAQKRFSRSRAALESNSPLVSQVAVGFFAVADHMKTLITIAMAFSTSYSAFADVFYNINFNAQPVNQVVMTGFAPQNVSQINFGTPVVVSSFGALTDQPLVFDNVGGDFYDQIHLSLPPMYPPSLDLVFDFTSAGLIGSPCWFAVLFDTPSVRNIWFNNDGTISLFIPGNEIEIGSFTNGEAFRVLSHIDLVNHQWSIFKNGALLASVPMQIDDYVGSIRFNYGILPSGGPGAAAIDNIVVSTPGGPPTISCPEPVLLECGEGAAATLQVQVEDASGNPLEVIWTVDDTPYQTNYIPSGGMITSAAVTFAAGFGFGPHSVEVWVSNGTDSAACSTTVTVREDIIAPQITSAAATPSLLWPPNHQMVAVTVVAEAVDNCGPATARIISVSSNEPDSGNDWRITGDLTVELRAKRMGTGRNRVYTILVEGRDAAGNAAVKAVPVTVPHDKRAEPSN
jgi:hypothetical protein